MTCHKAAGPAEQKKWGPQVSASFADDEDNWHWVNANPEKAPGEALALQTIIVGQRYDLRVAAFRKDGKPAFDFVGPSNGQVAPPVEAQEWTPRASEPEVQFTRAPEAVPPPVPTSPGSAADVLAKAGEHLARAQALLNTLNAA